MKGEPKARFSMLLILVSGLNSAAAYAWNAALDGGTPGVVSSTQPCLVTLRLVEIGKDIFF